MKLPEDVDILQFMKHLACIIKLLHDNHVEIRNLSELLLKQEITFGMCNIGPMVVHTFKGNL